MTTTILITGSTDGIGLETAKMLVSTGHKVLLHGRNEAKLATAKAALSSAQETETYAADLSRMSEVAALANAVSEKHERLDVLINNAGVYSTSSPLTEDQLDARFVVNTFAPYLLSKLLLPKIAPSGRVVNLSSAAQAPVDLAAMQNGGSLSASAAYAQSKLALTMWSRHMAQQLGDQGPIVVAVNPASMLGSKMVKDAYGVAGGDLRIGADILSRAALSDEFADASGKYYDNDRRSFSSPHPDALDSQKNAQLVRAIESVLEKLGHP